MKIIFIEMIQFGG